MSDIKAMVALLTGNAPLIAVVPAGNIIPGPLPLGATLPAITLAHISGVRDKQISEQGHGCIARVQATVHAPSYPKQKEIMPLLRAAGICKRSSHGGVAVDYVRLDSDGPDFRDDEAGIYMQTQDFKVRFYD